VNIYYTRKGKHLATVVNATHPPRRGDYVFLKVGEVTDPDPGQLFKVTMVAWSTERQAGGKLENPDLSPGDLYVVVEAAKDST
jgi:hypothetical protein